MVVCCVYCVFCVLTQDNAQWRTYCSPCKGMTSVTNSDTSLFALNLKIKKIDCDTCYLHESDIWNVN